MLSVIVLSVLLAAGPPAAWADVRASDLILEDYTVEASGGPANLFPNVDANYALLTDGQGTIYWSRNPDERTQIASITKIMTAMIAMERRGSIDVITVSERAADVGQSTAGLKAGDELSFEDALLGLMVPSGNDAAIALAETIGRATDPSTVTVTEEDYAYCSEQGVNLNAELQSTDPEQVFVALMNLKARAIGCKNTIFTNSHGLDGADYGHNFGEQMHSCASDVNLMASLAMQDETFRGLVDKSTVTIAVRHQDGQVEDIELETTDELLGVYEGSCGVKTGNTALAGPCVAGACQRGDTMLYAIVLNSSTEAQRFVDATNLYNWYFNNSIDYRLAQSETTATMTVDGQEREVPVVAQVAHGGWLDKTFAATFADPDETVAVFAAQGNVSQSIDLDAPIGNVNVGDVVGHATFYQDNVVIAETDVVSCETVPAPNLIDGIGIWWERLMRSLSGEEGVAASVIMNETPLIFNKAA